MPDFTFFASIMQDTQMARRLIRQKTSDSIASHVMQMHVIQTWLMQNGPTFFIEPAMVTACEQTDALSFIQGSDIKTVYPIGYFCLPDSAGFKSRWTGDTVRHMWFRIFEKGEEIKVCMTGNYHSPVTPWEEDKTFRSDKRRVMLLAYWDKSGESSDFLFPLDEPNKTISDVIRSYSKMVNANADRAEKSILERETEEFGQWAASLSVNLFLIMQSYPDYFDKLSPEMSRKSQQFENAPAPQSIIIRRSSPRDIRQVVKGESPEVAPPTGKTVAAHWRRGHWRRQPHEDDWELKNPEVKVLVLDDGRRAHMRWIEPIMVNMPD